MMNKKTFFSELARAGLVAAFLLASCSSVATSPTPANPTASPQPVAPSATASPQPATPTATETAIPSATATLLSSTPASTANTGTATLAGIAQVNPGWNAYCRKGPGTFYFAITYLQAGNFYPVVGRDGRDIWWLVQASPTTQCWEGDPTTSVEGPVEQAPVIQAPPLPSSPSALENTSHCDPVKNTMTVWLTWQSASGNTGYNIYRNGEMIASVGANATSYMDRAPRGVRLKYQIEAFNNYGVSASVGLKVDACV